MSNQLAESRGVCKNYEAVSPADRCDEAAGIMQNTACTYHHANVCFCLHIHCLVQHDVHELIKSTQCACHMPVGVQDDCTFGIKNSSSRMSAAAAACHSLSSVFLSCCTTPAG